MANLTPVVPTAAGVVATAVAASGGGDTIVMGGADPAKVVLRVKNGDVSSKTVTLSGLTPCSQGGLHDVTVTVAAGAEKVITIPAQCVDPTTGNVSVAYSAVTSVTVSVVKVA